MPNLNEQAALTKGKILHQQEVSYRDIAQVWVKEFGLPLYDAKSIKRMVDRVDR